MGEFKFTTRDKSCFNSEKTIIRDDSGQESGFSAHTSPLKPSVKTENKTSQAKQNKKELKTRDASTNSIVQKSEFDVEQIVNAVTIAKNSIVEEISATFEQKLEKLDEAIIELISCKAENERLKAKIDNLTRENYKLKKETKSFKQVMPGFFIKVKTEEINL